MLLGRIHTLTFWHVCAPKPQEENCCFLNRAGKVAPLHANTKESRLIEWKPACKVISCSRNKQIVNESCWIPWMLLNTWNISTALDLTSSPSYLACRMNFVCQNNFALYCKSLLNTDGDFPVAQKSAKKKKEKKFNLEQAITSSWWLLLTFF